MVILGIFLAWKSLARPQTASVNAIGAEKQTSTVLDSDREITLPQSMVFFHVYGIWYTYYANPLKIC